MKKESKIDVAVLITFFARPETLEKVFESVREARPSTLLLWQDGPRKNRPQDIENIRRCRAVVENIDWECKVYKNYHDENMGCDPSTFRAQKWAFTLVEKCIVLEDDMVPNQYFYTFCKELLDKYEHDERVNHICGVNFLGKADFCPNDYLFSYYGTGAWASWRRVANGWDSEYKFLDEPYYLQNMARELPSIFPVAYRTALRRRTTGFEWWETILGFGSHLNHRLVIIPKVNLVNNIGVTPEATHGTNLKLMPKQIRKLFFMKTYKMTSPIKHPEYIVPDYQFMDEMSKINCMGRPWLAKYRKVVYIAKSIIYGEFVNILKKKYNK